MNIQEGKSKMDQLTVSKIQAVWRGYRSRKGEVVPCRCCGHDLTVSTKRRYYKLCAWCDPKTNTGSRCETCSANKIQALWRGYRSRRGEIVPCRSCGYDLTLAKERCYYDDCSWCSTAKPNKGHGCGECDDWLCTGECSYTGYKAPIYDLSGNEAQEYCPDCGQTNCYGDCEPYISCRMCGSNCYDGDYPSWRFCSRSCMVEASRD